MSQNALKDTPIPKLLLSFAGPAVVGLLMNALYNIVDRIFVGQLVGAEGLSAVTLVFPVNLFQFGFVLLFGSGAGVLIGKYLGERKPEEAAKVLGNMMAGLLLIIGLFTSAGLFFYKSLLIAFGAEGTLLALSEQYFFVLILGFPLAFFLALEFTCRAEGNPKFPAILILISSLLNIVLDYVFMKYFDLGVRGAALATITAQASNSIGLLYYYLCGKSVIPILFKNIKLQSKYILPILSVGLSPFIMDITTSFQNVIANKLLLETGGTYAVAVMGILFGVNIFFMMTALGTGDGIQPIISYNYGAKRMDRTSQTLRYSLYAVVGIALVGILFLELCPGFITSLFVSNNPEINAMAKTALRVFALSIPFYTVTIVITRYFQALHQNKVATFLAILRPMLLFVPIIYILRNFYGLNGIWASFVVSDALSAIIAIALVRRSEKQIHSVRE